jgi:hypothetical protein
MVLIHLLVQFRQQAEGVAHLTAQAELGEQVDLAGDLDITARQMRPEHLGKVTLAGVEYQRPRIMAVAAEVGLVRLGQMEHLPLVEMAARA